MHYLFLLISLYAFWLLLSGYFLPLLLSLGGVSALILVWLLRRMDKVDAEPIAIRICFKLMHYIGWLLGQVVISNIDVARRIWDPKLPIQPCWEKLDIKVSSHLEKTIYANSITLTPGTLTTDVKEGHFLIHNLTPEGMQSLREGEMQRRIMDIGL
ncbi:MAG: cation transporter [Gammaproteobacteria bacterium]|nr:cation transporter [Gammaproteobacteria bacterium]